MDNLDAMFDDMLGELDIISQQLEDKSEKSSPPKQKTTPVVEVTSSQSTTVEQDAADIDLNAMLSDLTDWEVNMTPAPGPKVLSDENELGSNSLPRDAGKLSVQYGMDVSPQFNTLKRSTTDGPSVTFGEDDDLSLEALAKDIDQEKRQLDKSRQLSPEELASLSPVMQELDDLVSDLSNLSFHHNFERTSQKSITRVEQNKENSVQNNIQLTANKKPPPPVTEKPSFVNRNEHSSKVHQESRNVSNEQKLPPAIPSNSRNSAGITSPLVHQNVSEEYNNLRSANSSNQWNNSENRNFVSDPTEPPIPAHKPKPPVPPLPSSKPKLPEKPHNFNVPQRQRSTSVPVSPKPVTPIKRLPSVKAPANLSNILERQLSQKAVGEQQLSPTTPANRVPPSPTDSGYSTQPKSLIRHNSSEPQNTHPSDVKLGRKHSTSMVSVESNISTTSSVTSTKSESSTESATSSEFSRYSPEYTNDKYVPEDIKTLLNAIQKQSDSDQLTPEAREERVKAEKMRIALEKLKEARIQKLVVKVFNKDDSSKTLMVDERMTTRSVIKQLLEKNHYESSVNWALVEELPSLYMERIFEEHESVTEMLAYWTRDTANQVRFLERKDKYALFRNPQHYLLSVSDTEGQMAERQKQTLIEEFFSGRSGSGVPEVQGILHIKGESKSWSRKYCVLRNSGLYCSKSGEPKKGKKLSDLQCLVMFESVCVYLGRGWKKKHKSPTDYGFALKHPAIQTKSKHIRYFCCDDVRALMRWIVGIRCAKYGKQLKDNFDRTTAEMKSDATTVPYQPRQTDSTSNLSTGSGDADNEVKSVPRASITNMFGGAWNRANQQENAESAPEPHSQEAPQRTKSVWNPSKGSSVSSNWWDLGTAPELDELAEDTSSRPDSLSRKSTGDEGSVASQDSHIQKAPMPPPVPSNPGVPPPVMSTGKVMQPPPPPMKISVPPSQRAPSFGNKSQMPPPPPMKKVPPRPPMKFGSAPTQKYPPPPPIGPKPHVEQLPPPPMDDLPPPPPMDDMPPPPMDDLPPPPLDDDMPLPPPMDQINTSPMLPKGLRGVDGQAPVRLPFLPMFKDGNPRMNLRHAAPYNRPRGPPPPPKNFNHSNNKPPVLPREPNARPVQQRKSGGYTNRPVMQRKGSQSSGRAEIQAPLTDYYTTGARRGVNALYSSNDLPPPPEFIIDLKDTFYHVASSGNQHTDALDLPPPPPDLLLNEVRARRPYNAPQMSVKSPPPPPKRSPSTKLSFKR